MDKMEHCLHYSQIAAEPECMFIGGPTGAGKTTLQDYFRKKYPRTFNEEGAIIPVLCARVPNKATDKNLVTELLTKLGDVEATRGSSYNQTVRLRMFIRDCGVRLVILDEFQHFVDKDSKRVLKTVSDWLKNLIDQTEKPMILIGMPYADQILDAVGNEQLQRRFAVREQLDPFRWVTNEEQKEFRAFLKAVDDQLPLTESSHLSDPNIAFRFYCATNGVIAKVMKIVRRATELALVQLTESLTLDVLAEAYDDRLSANQPDINNPFRCDKDKLKITSLTDPQQNFRSTKWRLDSKAKKESASGVLKKN
jgi:Cdc6-like AAA superfamily ATPase